MIFHSFVVASATILSVALAEITEQFIISTADGDDHSVQRMDPILAPGSWSQHVHQFFGSSALDDNITYDSLQMTTCSTVGDSHDNSLVFDNSLYWHPALYMESNNGSGYIRIPTNGHRLYYRDQGHISDKKREPFEFPHGFRMIAGDPFMRQAAANPSRRGVTQWECHYKIGDHDFGTNEGANGGFPSGVTDCDAYPGFNGAIHFPHCWNGNDFDPSSPFAHMSYPTDDAEDSPCPADHPIRLPHIFIENQFDLHSMVDKVKPNTFVLAQGDNTGFGWHADFFNGWQDGAISTLFASCPHPNFNVGDCTAFKGRTTTMRNCKLPTKYIENVDTPGQFLPGCNPIIDQNPAPIMQIAALGIATDVCNTVGGATAPLTLSASTAETSVPTTANSIAAAETALRSVEPLDSITSPAPTTIYAQPTAVSVPSAFATFFSSQTLASAAPSTAAVSCPESHGTNHTVNDVTFQIECGTDHFGGNLAMKWVTGGLTECISVCSNTPGCVDVSLSGVACYMKKSLGKTLTDHGVNGAKVVSSCTSSILATMTVAPAYSQQQAIDMVYVTEHQTVTASLERPQRRAQMFAA